VPGYLNSSSTPEPTLRTSSLEWHGLVVCERVARPVHWNREHVQPSLRSLRSIGADASVQAVQNDLNGHCRRRASTQGSPLERFEPLPVFQ
jgi:hypothetical protein